MKSNYFYEAAAEVKQELTICNKAAKCDYSECIHRVPTMTIGMLNISGRCTGKGWDIRIIGAKSDDPNTQFIIKRGKDV